MRLFNEHPPGIRRNIAYVTIILVSGALIYFLVVREMRFFMVPSSSMTPTLVPPEYLMTLKSDEYRRGDIVVLTDPSDSTGYLVKRIVGLPGDVIEIRGGATFLNSHYLSEPYCDEPMDYEMPPHTVLPGHYFILGDNRNWSVDSHDWNHGSENEPRAGGVPMDSVVGKVRYIYLPLRHMRAISSYPLAEVAGSNGLEFQAGENTRQKHVQ